MLEALLGLLVITFIGWFISIFKKFNRFIKEGSDFTTTQLVCLLISNFVIVSGGVMVIGTIIGSIIEEVNSIHTEQSASLIVIIPLIAGIILSSYGDYCIYETYLKQQKKLNKNSETISCQDGNGVIFSKWRMKSFESIINIIILSMALISCLISLGGFGYYCSYSYRDNGFYNQWLIASFISALFIGIWYYLNYQRFTVEQCKKYGVIFIVAGFLSLISPFIALALLIEGTIMLKRVFDDKRHSNTNSIQNGNNEITSSDNFDVNSLQLWIDGSLKDLQSVYLKDSLTSDQQLQAVIYLVSLLCYKPNAPTEQIIKYVSTKYSIPENILSQYIKDYRYYRTLLAEDILGYTSMVVCKLCIYKPETSLEQIVELGKDNNLRKILNRFPQHKVTTNNIAFCNEHDKNNDTIPNNGTYIIRSLSIYLDEFEQITIGLAYSMEILK